MDHQPGGTQMQREPASPPMGQERGSAPSQARGAISAEFRTALEPHGRWQRHGKWGEVWIPANRSRDWRPYTVGHWAYTDDWGWYWISDESEASWGTVTYHYGRWIFDDDIGWSWVAGNEWAPAWVSWRQGRGQQAQYVGWAPLPPDEVVVEYYEQPRYWVFVRGRDFVAPRIASVILPVREYDVVIRETVVVNQTVVVRDRGEFAVNPGIEPSIVAAYTGRPLRIYDVRPVVLAGTAQIAGAVTLRAEDLRRRDFRPQIRIQETRNSIRPADRLPEAQPLAAGERGRLGDTPPRAAQRTPAAPPTTGQAPTGQQPQPQQRGEEKQQQPQQGRPQEQGLQKGKQKQEMPAQQQGRPKQEMPAQQQGRTKQETPAQQQGRTKQEAPLTQGRGSEEGRGKDPQRQPPAVQQRQGKEGRGAAEERQPQTQRPGAAPERQQPQTERAKPSPRQDQGTSGRGGASEPSRAAPQPRDPGGTKSAPQGRERGGAAGPTEGRGGGGAGAANPQRERGGPPTGGAR